MCSQAGVFDLVDDGSHINTLLKVSSFYFELKNGYLCYKRYSDLSCVEEYGGSSTDFNRSRYYFIIYLNR
jgi:hypothetical protein